MKLSRTVKPISFFKAHASNLVKDVHNNHETYVITHRGEAKAVVQDIAAYEQTQESLALLKMLALSQNSVQKGRYKPVRKAFGDLEKTIKNRA